MNLKNLKDKDGLYMPWVPLAITAAAIAYILLCVFVFFPAADRLLGR